MNNIDLDIIYNELISIEAEAQGLIRRCQLLRKKLRPVSTGCSKKSKRQLVELSVIDAVAKATARRARQMAKAKE